MAADELVREPETPLHAEPNEQLDLNAVQELDEQDIADLDLGPTFDESLPPSANASSVRLHDAQFDNANDFKPRINVGSPFSSSFAETNSKGNSGTGAPPVIRRRLSMSQQSKFISYVDQRFMDIQRKFVQSRGLNNKTGYKSLDALLRDIKSLIDFIWYSIDNEPNTDSLLQLDANENDDNENEGDGGNSRRDHSSALHNHSPNQSSDSGFGQASYLIRIADDMLDYIEKFHIDATDHLTISKVFKLFFIMDRIFVKLINGVTANNIKLNKTDMIRFSGIAQRSRVKLPIYFEKLGVQGYHYELSKIYEESLEMCTCS
ncbi:TFIIH complex subunit TFB6 KNAG_0E00350 [Huiozyma naganishii CBS 8797]|uniref:Uncharacterized protein n=1 Tax=Huiozyma naganishii (strain ATCC MYA-139 / BCRC 22969 / CBS 8797 / KCTC 17520 / NBRC 10181 / NCYC 3082 / Yp74L-3) TaxID=1071383 RepID=J7RLB0_HUIN7|nr:hypothetical protein KNAG_0E00350 [Kazachstania naganishii CBS 8797]CCK70303.1 hypothetical protein KNAG_0E00350 [Kazachstania naganishii CBS 8797]